MSEQLKEWLPNPTFVDYQVPHDGQGADFYDEHKMLEYGKRIVMECEKRLREEGNLAKIQAFTGSTYKFAYMHDAANIVKQHFGVE